MAPPTAIDQWTETGDELTEFEDQSSNLPDSWEEEGLSTPCREPCTDPKRYGRQSWAKKCKMNVCKSCGPCKKSGPPPAPPSASRRRGSSKHRRRGASGGPTTRRRRGSSGGPSPPKPPPGKRLIWSDEFDDKSCKNGRPGAHWGYEEGFVRNEEHQWYQKDNARCVDGKLVITSGKHARGKVKNPNYKRGSKDWKTNREYITYTSSALTTQGKRSFGLGVFEMRAKVDVREGSWPAWWTLGENINDEGWSWPRCERLT